MDEASTVVDGSGDPAAVDEAHGESWSFGVYLWLFLALSAVGYYALIVAGGRKTKLGTTSASVEDVRRARLRQLELLSQAARDQSSGRESINDDRNTGKKVNQKLTARSVGAATGAESADLTAKKQAAQTAAKEKRRKMYLRRKAELEAEEERRRKEEELGPGWQYREDPGGAPNAYNAMNPDGGEGSGGYRASKRCVRRGG